MKCSSSVVVQNTRTHILNQHCHYSSRDGKNGKYCYYLTLLATEHSDHSDKGTILSNQLVNCIFTPYFFCFIEYVSKQMIFFHQLQKITPE